VLYEYQPAPPEHLAASSQYQDAWPVRFEPADFGRFDSESESALLYGAARRGVTLAGRELA
jgi:hypothetical protein